MVIGRVINIDVDPADVTISAQFRDKNGKLLATYDAAQTTLRIPGQPTMTGFPRSSGASRCSTDA